MLIKYWNETVGVDDTVYCLGDFSMNKKYVTEITPRLNGRKFLCPGNHDDCFPFPNRSPEKAKNARARYEDVGWTILDPQVTLTHRGRELLLCHFPYHGDHTERERFWELRPKNEGKLLLHGHCHGAWKFKGNMIDVGVDVWNYKPVDLDLLLAEYFLTT
jgi:calcineurin-like phosphoesterase family protein